MQEAERATFKAGSVTWKKSKDSISLDSKALLKSHPEYLNQFHKLSKVHDVSTYISMMIEVALA
jgi:hypothetical protein